jgi:hypothetical protein
MRIKTLRSLFLAAPFLACCWGCGPGAGTSASLIAVKGKVIYKNQPLSKGVVQFEPDGYGRAASGTLQSDGTFVMSTFKEGDGVVAGHHRVSISGVDRKVAKDRAFVKYSSPNTSNLSADVSKDNTDFTFAIP